MSNPNNNDDLFSASLDSIETSARVEKFLRFKEDFHRECKITLDNAQEWIKAELPMVTGYIDLATVKDELKQSKISNRRKYLLSALLFEKCLREAIEKNDATTAAMMAIQMVNNMWLAKVELHGLHTKDSETSASKNDSAVKTYNDTREKILTTLIEKGEKLKQESQIQTGIQNKKEHNITLQNKASKPTSSKPNSNTSQRKVDLWTQEAEKARQLKRFANVKPKQEKKKSNGVLAKVKTRLPLRRSKTKTDNAVEQENKSIEKSPEDSLLDNPNNSAIMVNPGFSDSIDDSLIKARAEIFKDPNSSGVTVHKILKKREHQKQEPGSNTIIMKLASSSGKRPGSKLSIPEQCQAAINMLSQQFPGYDMVAIRHMAAKKVGVSPQYIENLNILPEKTG